MEMLRNSREPLHFLQKIRALEVVMLWSVLVKGAPSILLLSLLLLLLLLLSSSSSSLLLRLDLQYLTVTTH